MKEANIIKKFRDKLPGHWTSIENSVTSGVPDYVVSRNGHMHWIEFKRLYGYDIILRPLQRNWMVRELRHNQHVWVAWWDDGPVVINAEILLQGEAKEKGGKLYYDVSDCPHIWFTWAEINQVLFED